MHFLVWQFGLAWPLYFLQLTVWQFSVAGSLHFMHLGVWQIFIAGPLFFVHLSVCQSGKYGPLYLLQVTVWHFGIAGPLYFLQLTLWHSCIAGRCTLCIFQLSVFQTKDPFLLSGCDSAMCRFPFRLCCGRHSSIFLMFAFFYLCQILKRVEFSSFFTWYPFFIAEFCVIWG